MSTSHSLHFLVLCLVVAVLNVWVVDEHFPSIIIGQMGGYVLVKSSVFVFRVRPKCNYALMWLYHQSRRFCWVSSIVGHPGRSLSCHSVVLSSFARKTIRGTIFCQLQMTQPQQIFGALIRDPSDAVADCVFVINEEKIKSSSINHHVWEIIRKNDVKTFRAVVYLFATQLRNPPVTV